MRKNDRQEIYANTTNLSQRSSLSDQISKAWPSKAFLICVRVFVCVHACSPGLWKVVAKFHSNPQESFSAEFEVKEYGESLLPQALFTVKPKKHSLIFTSTINLLDLIHFHFLVLPSFEVKLTPSSSFFYVDSPDLTINIKATYVKVFVLWFYRDLGNIRVLSEKAKIAPVKTNVRNTKTKRRN